MMIYCHFRVELHYLLDQNVELIPEGEVRDPPVIEGVHFLPVLDVLGDFLQHINHCIKTVLN